MWHIRFYCLQKMIYYFSVLDLFIGCNSTGSSFLHRETRTIHMQRIINKLKKIWHEKEQKQKNQMHIK